MDAQNHCRPRPADIRSMRPSRHTAALSASEGRKAGADNSLRMDSMYIINLQNYLSINRKTSVSAAGEPYSAFYRVQNYNFINIYPPRMLNLL